MAAIFPGLNVLIERFTDMTNADIGHPFTEEYYSQEK